MKKFRAFLVSALAMTVALAGVACGGDDEDAGNTSASDIKIELVAGTTTDNSISFTATVTGATDAGFLVKKVGEVPTKAEMLRGTALDVSGVAKEYTVKNLEKGTPYVVYAAAMKGSTTKVGQLAMATSAGGTFTEGEYHMGNAVPVAAEWYGDYYNLGLDMYILAFMDDAEAPVAMAQYYLFAPSTVTFDGSLPKGDYEFISPQDFEKAVEAGSIESKYYIVGGGWNSASNQPAYSFYMQFESAAADADLEEICLPTGGSLKASGTGVNTKITCYADAVEATTGENTSISMTFNGELEVEDKNFPVSTLDGDYAMTFGKNHLAALYFYGGGYLDEGRTKELGMWAVEILDSTAGGDAFSIAMFTNKKDVTASVAGNYTAMVDYDNPVGTYAPGEIMDGGPASTFYFGIKIEGEEAYYSDVALIYDGTIAVTQGERTANPEFDGLPTCDVKFTFNCLDPYSNKVTGEYSGMAVVVDATAASQLSTPLREANKMNISKQALRPSVKAPKYVVDVPALR